MKPFLTRLFRLISSFPRGHLLATVALFGLLSAAVILPTSDATPTAQPAVVALSLPRPASREADPEQAGTPAASPEAVAEEPAIDWREITVSPGDTLSRLLQAQGVSPGEVHRLVTADKRLAALTNIRPGDVLRVALNDDNTLAALEHQVSRIKSLHAERTEDGWSVREEEREYERQVRYAQAEISDSLFLAAQRAGMTDNLIMQLVNIYAWDIDFVLDIRQGDSFQVLYEELFLDGEQVGTGNILMAEFNNRDRKLTAFRYETQEGNTEFLDIAGNSLRREFIRTPVEFARISSRFNPNRRHPVLNTIRAHRGVDYAAPTGTPIRATGDGRVEFAGVRGGYGNVVIIRHGQQYSTLYAHMNSFARGIRTGVRVRQGQTIGTVGMTGLATGPHLHYEFLVNGVHRDPLTVKLPKARGIADNERRDFLVYANRLRNQMALHAEAFTLAQNF